MEYARIRLDEHWMLLCTLVKWLILGSLAGVLSGLASALFLHWLGWATSTRGANPQLLWFLPIGGLAIGLVHHHFGALAKLGNNLILEEVYEPRRPVPFRMAPLVLFGTITTHLFGGSAGREGTGIQMAGSLTDSAARLLRLSLETRRTLLIASIAGGFGSVFGTPLAGAVFALEVLRVGRISYRALFPAGIAALVGDRVTSFFISHTHYHVAAIPEFSAMLVAKLLLVGLVFGLGALLFTEMTHGMKVVFARVVSYPPLRLVLGGSIVVLLTIALGTQDYNGLGIPFIADAVAGEEVFLGAFFLKTLLTAITIGAGFQGGEVTPLFFVGASLGNALGQLLGVSPGFIAALGFVAVFAGATNTPLACTLMGIELFGADLGIYLALACFTSYVFSGHRGIYTSQRTGVPKSEFLDVPADVPLEELKTVKRPSLNRERDSR